MGRENQSGYQGDMIYMETLRINYVIHEMGRNGGVRVLLNFANELYKLGHEVTISTGHRNNWFRLDDSIKINSLNKYNFYFFYGMGLINKKLNWSNLFNELKFLRNIESIVPKSDANIATYAPTAFVVYWKSRETFPFYHMQHMETLFHDSDDLMNLVKATYYLPIAKVANSTWLRDRVMKLTGEKVDILNPAIEHQTFYPRGKPNNKSIDIVAIGKEGWKNSKLIYEAVNEVRNKKITNKQIILHFFGYRIPSGIQIDNHKTVFHKDISDDELARLYSKSYVQITASTAESFPLPPLEAMACGTAVITTPYGVEDYAVHEENSIIIQPNNKNEMKSALIKLIEDENLRNKLTENGLRTAARFNYKDQALIYEKILRKSMNIYNTNIRETRMDFSKFGLQI